MNRSLTLADPIVVSKIDLQRNSSLESKPEKNSLQHHLLVDKQELN